MSFMSAPLMQDLEIFTIGHSNLSIGHFVNLLKECHIVCLVDVRSVPYSKHNGAYSKDNLSVELLKHGIEYLWMGDSLGGRRHDLQSSLGKRHDDAYNDDPFYRSGISSLIHKAIARRTAMMCSEDNPRECHRHKIIAQTLLNGHMTGIPNLCDIRVIHLRGNGKKEDASRVQSSIQTALPF
jgi:uncharacterized protein (DUF488 family)